MEKKITNDVISQISEVNHTKKSKYKVMFNVGEKVINLNQVINNLTLGFLAEVNIIKKRFFNGLNVKQSNKWRQK